MDNQFTPSNNQTTQTITPENEQGTETKTALDNLANSLDSKPATTPVVSPITPINPGPAPTQSAPPALSTPIMSGDLKPKRARLMSLVLVLVAIIILIGGGYELYSWQHKKVTSLNTQVQSLNLQVSTLQSQLTAAKLAASSATVQNVFKITELGVQFKVPTILADLTYAANTQKTVVNVSSQTLTVLDAACTANATTGKALGNISKVTGQFPTTPTTTTTLVKQFPTFYIAYTSSPSACSTVAQVNSLSATLVADLKTAFSTISLSQ